MSILTKKTILKVFRKIWAICFQFIFKWYLTFFKLLPYKHSRNIHTINSQKKKNSYFYPGMCLSTIIQSLTNKDSLFLIIQQLNLHPFCCMAAKSPTRHAPWENPINPSNGPYSLTTPSISRRVSSKPIAGPPRHLPLNVLSSALNHHDRESRFKKKI